MFVYQVPTACKTCTCGFLFKRNVPPAQPATTVDNTSRRRTGRVKKEPNYFNTMEYDHHFKRKKPKTKPIITKDDTSDSKEGHASSNCDTPQVKDDQERVKEELQDSYINLSPEKSLQYAIILAEINRKFLGQNFQPS
ncbi:hypothetical protein LSH36_12g03052 [Paralvinella palmiformis]|uniref:Uncharacterized protein n=1 Tax=Paralvinella palmiformis TaxID=53620 RepID=A0AAD9KD82_9ANNE|nr:hypothetical protein LSH36_12g03052 [Paralvinella palmiformis]